MNDNDSIVSSATEHPGFLVRPELIEAWLQRYCTITGTYTISEDGGVAVNGVVKFNTLATDNVTHLMVRFTEVSRSFILSYMEKLVSLEGSPPKTGGDFYCNDCKSLTSLYGAPQEVGGKFNCSYSDGLRTLEGAPRSVGGWFGCYACGGLMSLRGVPARIDGNFDCFDCENLQSLEGAPHYVAGRFDCHRCFSLTSLLHAPITVGHSFICKSTPIDSLEGVPQTLSQLDCSACQNLTNLNGLTRVGQSIRMSYIDTITPELTKACIENHVNITTDMHEDIPEVEMINAYHQSGDLLAAIEQFEAHFGLSFYEDMTTEIPDMPTL